MLDGVIIMPASEDDWEAFGRIRLASLREPGSPQAASLGREEGFREPHWRMRLRGTMYLLAWEDEDRRRAVGMIGIMQEPGAPVEERLLVSLYVRESHRRQGIGKALLRAATHWAAVDDAKVVSAWVVDGEEPAMGLFSRCGFELTGERVRLPRSPDRYEARWSLALASDDVVQQRRQV
jgi:GNAT superfamily N-acetyltransferase